MNISKTLCISTLLLAGGFGFEALAQEPTFAGSRIGREGEAFGNRLEMDAGNQGRVTGATPEKTGNGLSVRRQERTET